MMIDRKLPLLSSCHHHSLLPSNRLSAWMRFKEEPPLSSPNTTTGENSRAIKNHRNRNGSDRDVDERRQRSNSFTMRLAY